MGKVEHKPTQNQRILDYIDKFGSITQIDAIRDLGVMRLASRVSDLKSLGYPIFSTTEAVRNRFGEKCHIKRYFLVDKEVIQNGGCEVDQNNNGCF